jgi:hypothetical protein
MKQYIKTILKCLCVVAFFALLAAAIVWVDSIDSRPGHNEMLEQYEGSSPIRKFFGN